MSNQNLNQHLNIESDSVFMSDGLADILDLSETLPEKNEIPDRQYDFSKYSQEKLELTIIAKESFAKYLLSNSLNRGFSFELSFFDKKFTLTTDNLEILRVDNLYHITLRTKSIQ